MGTMHPHTIVTQTCVTGTDQTKTELAAGTVAVTFKAFKAKLVEMALNSVVKLSPCNHISAIN
ncbi:hypothetical protein ABVT39_017459, partial [Epinephelus coioides]